MTNEVIKDKILEDRKLITLRPLVKRDFEIREIDGFATVITGARRSGKSSFLRLYAQKLVATGVPIERICYLSFFDSAFDAAACRIDLIVNAFYSLNPSALEEKTYFLFDEVQKLGKWGEGISRLMDMHDCVVIVTGSSAKYLSTDIATELRGRSISRKFFPLSFKEFLRFNGMDEIRTDAFTASDQIKISNLFDLFTERGSYPALYNIDNEEERLSVLNAYFSLTFSLDIVERFEVTKANALQALLRRLVQTAGTPLSIRKLKHYMDSIGFKVSTELISSYLNMIKDTMFMRELRILGNENVQNTNPIKLYTADHAIPSLFNYFTKNTGMRYEHMVFSALQRKYEHIFYYRTKNDYEIDFVVTDGLEKIIMLIQVTDDYAVSKDRELRSFEVAMKELKADEYYLLTRENMEELRVNGEIIKVMPIWRFLLQF